ncbi:MAG TPA: amino acid adenylation domain-containing protein [Thermoanaerobaculia bacterium]|nr:amino acid adenylation domain-containing protein [Thermoanaerobaculia bacterium]
MSELSGRLAGLSAEKRELLEALLRKKRAEAASALTIPPRGDAPGPLPLSFSQETLWLTDQLDPGSAAYNISIPLRFTGELDERALRQSLAALVHRHEALRTRFVLRDGSPAQEIDPPGAPPIPRVELSGLPADQTEALRLMEAEALRPFDLERGPLFRCVLVRLPSREHLLLTTLHHIVSDGWSTAIFARELGVLYTGNTLAPLPIQYADFALWQRRTLAGPVLEKHLAFWWERLAGLDPVLELPSDRPRPARRTPRGQRVPFFLPAAVSGEVKELARRDGTTLYATLLAAFFALLHRQTYRDDLCVGTPVAGRRQVETEGLIGYFVNILAVRADIPGEPAFREHLTRVHEAVLDAQAHQDLPFDRIVSELAPERSLSYTPIFQVAFTFQNTSAAVLDLPGISVRGVDLPVRAAKFDLTLVLWEEGERIAGGMEYSLDLFDEATAVRSLAQLEAVLTAVGADPEIRLSAIPLLSPAERRQLLEEWGGKGEEPPVGETLYGRFEAQVRRTPEAPAVTCEGTTLSYAELNRRANRLAHRLRELGVGPDSRVGLRVERSLDLVTGILGILKAGGAYVPLDPNYPAERLAYMIGDAGVRTVVGTDVLFDELTEALPSDDLAPAADGSNLAYVIYTSGSTGRPKGALVTHGNVVRLFDATDRWFGFGERDVWTLFHSYAFDFSVWEVWGALLYGGRVVVVPYEVSRSPESFLDLLVREGVTVLNQTPSAFAQLARVDEERGGVPTDLRFVVFGGEALDLPSLAPWFARHGDEKPTLVNMYGITETTVHVTYRPLRAEDTRGEGRSVIGTPIPDLSLYVLDPWMQPAPVGVPGELVVGGAGLARGYLGRPELTAARFVPDPVSGRPGARLYRSGDLGRFLRNGDVEYLGRIDHQVKIRGFRIELGEIQTALEACPGVRQAVVLPREEPTGERRLLAFIVTQPGQEPSTGELRASLARRLPDYMVPAMFVLLESLPLTQNGKVDRKALLSLAVPAREEGMDYAPPRTEVERLLAEVWQEVLGIGRVGIGDSFFALGGDSISSIRVRSLAAARGLHFELQELFRHPTLEDLAAAIGGAVPQESFDLEPFALVSPQDRELLPEGIEDAYPPSLLQLGMLFHSVREPGSAAYHNVSSFILRGSLDPAVLASAVERLAARHPLLRTSFDMTSFSEPLQLVHREAPIPLEITDLRGLPPAERERAVAERFEAEKRLLFDWSRPGLLRFWAQALTEDTFEVGVTEHHAILDGWSVSTLLSELFDLVLGTPPAPPPPPTVFRDFIALERQAVESGESHRFWSERLAGHTVLELPRWPGKESEIRRIGRVAAAIPAATEDVLGQVAEAAGVPLKSVLLAAHLRVLERLGGGIDVLTGLVSNGRPEIEGGERALGLFLNTLPLRMKMAEGTWTDLARAAFQAEIEVLPHRRLPLAELQRRFSGVSGGGPLFEVTFNYTHFHVLENTTGIEILAANLIAETNFVLTAHITRGLRPGQMRIDFQYDTRELQAAQVESWTRLYLRALDALAREPGQPWAADPLLSEDERRQLVQDWNNTRAPLPAACLHELVEAQVDQAPDAVAVIAGSSSLTYRELDVRANHLAHRLRSLGVGPDVLVGLCAERSLEMVVGMLAILKAGGAYVPLDPDYPTERLAYLLEDSGVRVLLTQRRLEIPSGTARVLLLEEETGESPDRPLGGATPDNLAYVIYTSGSTGRPKGVLVRHGGVVNRILWAQRAYPVTPDDRILQKASFSFDFSVWECFGPLIAGARVVLARPGEQRDSASLVRTIQDQGITMIHFIPSMLQAFVAEEGLEDCTSLRYVFSGGEALSLELQQSCLSRVPAVLRNQYGPTEISIDTTDWICRPEDSRLGFVPLGYPLSNTAVYILDGRLDPVLPGVPGELFVGGEGVARGYWKRSDLTAEKFLPDPFSEAPGSRLYRTGDRAVRLPDGNLRFLGRADHQVKIRGFRIEPGEIEAALRTHPEVREAVVIARESAGGDRRLVAYVIPGPSDEGELRSFLAGSLPAYMIPSAFVRLPALPLSPNGKLDRNALPDPGQAVRQDRETVPPRDEMELRLVQLWEELLDVRPVGVHDDFFALGGHSLLALRLMGGIERLFGRRVPLSALLEAPTVERMAGLLRRETPASRSLIVPIRTGGSGSPLFLVHPVGGNVLCYLPLAGLDRPVYAIQSPAPGSLPEWTVESLAALYLDAIREVQPEGPWLLGGWSLGGVVAFEMARQSNDVALLLMIDVAPPAQGEPGEPDASLDLTLFIEDLRRLAGVEARGKLPETLEALLEREEVRTALPPDVGPDRLRELFAVFQANRRALQAYRPRPFHGQAVLIRAEATAASDSSGRFEAWRELITDRAEIQLLPGNHYSLLREPRLAEVLTLSICETAGFKLPRAVASSPA